MTELEIRFAQNQLAGTIYVPAQPVEVACLLIHGWEGQRHLLMAEALANAG